ncbi:MAG TPA: LLM class flavin-dependent oxidoreductase [Bryobacteraceae bacterium]|jgi:luciferase family oxidoreductase group 1|nr:LLM class flavin-dependent oxidoreductase [Bryobacteraceae bacterium]
MPDLRISVLDQCPIPDGFTAGDALRNSIDLARLCDGLGYTRYWVAEHHGTKGLACASPEALIAPIASATTRLRVGSGGVMLPHYSPFKVAETFSMLAGLYPGRIDLGIGRAAGTSPKVAFMLQRDRRQAAPDDFREQLDELLGYLANRTPYRFASPDVWLLGSSHDSAIWAAELGLPYVFADFINPNGAPIARYYRQQFTPSELSPTARAGVATWAICADSEEEALELSLSFRMMMTMLFRGQSIAVPTIEHARRFLEEERLLPGDIPAGRRILTGTPERVRENIEKLARDYEAEEVLIVNILHDHAARRRSYELIAKAFGLDATEPAVL